MEPVIINEWLYERGRGPELRSCRLTVNELYPMLVPGTFSDAQLLEWYPITPAELDAVKQYIADNAEALAVKNAEIDARIARRIAEQDTPEMRARLDASRETVRLMKVWLEERKRDPSLFPHIDGESRDEHRERYKTAFRLWRGSRPVLSEVG